MGNFNCSFDVHWTKAGSDSCMAADMRQLGSKGVEESPIAAAPLRRSLLGPSVKLPAQADEHQHMTDKQKSEQIRRLVPELQDDIVGLSRWVVPKIRSDINDVQQDLDMIITTLRKRGLQKGDKRACGAEGRNFSLP